MTALYEAPRIRQKPFALYCTARDELCQSVVGNLFRLGMLPALQGCALIMA